MIDRDGAPPWRVLEHPARGARSDRADLGVGSDATSRPTDGGGVDHRLVAVGVVVASLLAAGAFVVAGAPEPSVRVETAGSGSTATASAVPGGSADEIVVDVGGAVRRPGIVRLPAGSRVADAIAAAGGFGPRVDGERVERELNLAARLADGDHLHVPSRDDPPVSPTGGAPASGRPGSSGATSLLDLNSATAAELEALPGIGPVTAAKIVAAREEARFASVDDLRTRKLVGQATFEKIRDLVTVR